MKSVLGLATTGDTGSADVPKLGYARVVTGQFPRPDGTMAPFDFIVGSGLCLRPPG